MNKTIKKLSKVGEGTAVFLTREIKKLGWRQGDYASVEIDEKEGIILLKKINL